MVSDKNKFGPREGELLFKGNIAIRGGVCCREKVLNLRSVSVSKVRPEEFSFIERNGQGYKEQGVGEWVA